MHIYQAICVILRNAFYQVMDHLLVHEQEKFEAVFQNASLGILVIDKTGRIVLANRFSLSLFGYDNTNNLIGQPVEILIPGRYHHNHVADRSNFVKDPQTRPMGMGRDLFGIRKDGTEIPLEISLSSYKNTEGIFSIAFISDISARVETQQKLQEQRLALAAMNKKMEILNEDLEQKVDERTKTLQETLDKLAASRDKLSKALSKEKDLSDLKSSFVSMASHEFRTPLSTILSSASLLAKYRLTEEQDKRDKHVQRIKSSVFNLNNILNEFLSLGKIEDGRIHAVYTHFDLEALITTQYHEMTDIFKSGQAVHYQHEGEKMVKLDETLFKNILINLLSNAAKFSEENKNIYLKSRVTDKDIQFQIQDEGIGISEHDLKHLSEIFFRGQNAVNIQGTGLGLHIVTKYMEMMNGTISIKSELNKGTTINLSFLR